MVFGVALLVRCCEPVVRCQHGMCAALGRPLIIKRASFGICLALPLSSVLWQRTEHPNVQVNLFGRALLPPGIGDRIVVVRDDEPTSIIAFFLSSR